MTKNALQTILRGIYAVRTRLELATFGVTGRHSNQLNYRTRYAGLSSKAIAKIRMILESANFI